MDAMTDPVDPDDIEAAVALHDAYASELGRLWRRYSRAVWFAVFLCVVDVGAALAMLVCLGFEDWSRAGWATGVIAVISAALFYVIDRAEERGEQWKELFSWTDSGEQ